VNFIDTAAYYGPEVANRLIMEALYPYPKDLFIATKFGAKRLPDKSWVAAMRPQELRAACEENLRQLRLERLNLVHCRHMEDSGVPFAESVGTLAELQREGKIQHIGVSNINLAQLREAQDIVPIVSVQNLYNLEHREQKDVLDACTQEKIVFAPFFPLATGKLGQAGGVVATVAQKHGVRPAQIALAWLLAHSPAILTIPGTSSVSHLEENIAAGAITLSAEEIAEIEEEQH
jgi:aryl-alcohol dehydrogenase-like predicted oxidoreductase